jgi:hypothetical protein
VSYKKQKLLTLREHTWVVGINVREYQRGQSKFDNPEKTGNIVYTRRRKTKQKHNTICVEHHYPKTQIT